MPMINGLSNLVKKIWPLPQRVQLVLSFLLFALTTRIILAYPLGRPIEILRHGFPTMMSAGSVRFQLATDLAAWFVCLACLILMWRLTNSLSDDLPFLFTRYVLLIFVLFFAIERVAGRTDRWSQLHWLSHRPQSIQLFSSIMVAAAAAVVLPHMRGMKEGSAITRKEHERFLASAESTLDDFYIFDGVPDASGKIVDFRFSYINPNAERRLNVKRESLIGKILTEVRPFMISSGLIENYREVVRTGIPFICEVFVDDDMIKATWLNVQVVKLGEGIAITSRDVTERKRLTDHIYKLAHYDQLTGLPNRTLFHDRLQQAILRAQRQGQKIAVFLIDIDHFKRINDSLGHANGDALLSAVASRLLAAVRETDTVARMGGDEFVIVMPDFKSLEDVERCGALIVQSAARPIIIGNRDVNITVSIGACIYPDYGLEVDQLLKNADTAMYVVKDTGRNGLHIFTEGMIKESATA
jgi:diguanylate cyclase (GGDEF)-like protein